MRFLINRSAEQDQNRFAEHEVDCRQHKAADHAEHDGIADRPVRVLAGVSSQGDAHKRAAAVADEHGDAERHHCQRKHDGVCRIAVGAEVAGVCNKNLVNNVIERTYQ